MLDLPSVSYLGNHEEQPLPFQGAMVTKTSAQTITTGTTPTVLTWATEVFDEGGFWSSGSPTKFIVPANGYAQVYGGVRWATVSSATARFVRPSLNGAAFKGGGGMAMLAPVSNSGARQCFMTAMVPVVAGDEFTMEVGHARGSNLDVNADNQTYFGIRFISQMDGALLELTSAESLASSTLLYVPWDAAVFDTMGAWSSGDPTKLVAPLGPNRKLRFYAGTRWTGTITGGVLTDIDRDTGSRGGLGVDESLGPASVFGARQCAASALMRPSYSGGYDDGTDTPPNSYKLQVEYSGSTTTLAADPMTYLGVERVVGLKDTLIRHAADEVIATGTQTTVDWGNKPEHDDVGMFNPAATDRLTIPSGYRYAVIMVNLSWDTNTTGDRWAELWKNGATFAGGAGKMVRASNLNRTRTHLHTIVPVAAGDYFQVKVWQNSGSDRTLIEATTACFSITLIP